jgi:hypothetical protein
MSTTTKRKEGEGGGLGGSHPEEEEETETLLSPRKLPGVFLFPTSDLETESLCSAVGKLRSLLIPRLKDPRLIINYR